MLAEGVSSSLLQPRHNFEASNFLPLLSNHSFGSPNLLVPLLLQHILEAANLVPIWHCHLQQIWGHCFCKTTLKHPVWYRYFFSTTLKHSSAEPLFQHRFTCTSHLLKTIVIVFPSSPVPTMRHPSQPPQLPPVFFSFPLAPNSKKKTQERYRLLNLEF